MNQENENFNQQYSDIKGSFSNIDKLKINRVTIAIMFLIVAALFIYVTTPNLNPHFASALNIYIIVATIAVLLVTKSLKKTVIVYLVSSLLLLGASFLSSPIFHSESYYNLIGDVQTYDYKETQPDIDSDLLPVVDEELARILGDKVLGEEIGLGSQFAVGEYYLVSTADDLAWVAPLEPRDFFKWFQNREGAPGYVYVSATNPNDVRLVQDIDGEPLHIKYSNDAFFFKNIKRHTYFSGNMFKGMTDFSFEIDDQGNPYWVITSYEPSIMLKGEQVVGVIIVDAQTGETNYYDDYSNAPEWVERIQPKSLVIDQINSWGAYKNGFINTIFGQKEMIRTTPGSSYVYIDNQPYFYTGLTSITNDQSTVGFMLVNSRTKEASFYQITGATEEAAQQSAQGQVQQFGYKASFPILVNQNNTPAYFMTLKDTDGLIKQYAYVSVENYNIVGVGDTISAAQKAYYSALKDNGKVTTGASELDTKVEGNIERINYVDGNYYIKLQDNAQLFVATSDTSDYLPYTKEGDSVAISFMDNDENISQITEFTNTTLQ